MTAQKELGSLLLQMRPRPSPGSSSICLHGCILKKGKKKIPRKNSSKFKLIHGFFFDRSSSTGRHHVPDVGWISPFSSQSKWGRWVINHTWELSGHQNHENTSTSPIPLGRNPPQWQGHLDGTYPGPFTMSRRELNGSGHILRSDFVFALCPTLGVRHCKPALQTWSNEGSLPGTEEANICEGRCRGKNSHPKCRSM